MFLVVKKFLHDGLWVTSFFLFVPKKKKEKSIVGSNSRATGYRCVSLLGLKRETQNTVSIDIANRRFPYLSSDPFEYSFCRNKRYCPVLSSRLLTHKPGKTVYEYFCSTNISFLSPLPPPSPSNWNSNRIPFDYLFTNHRHTECVSKNEKWNDR